MNEYILEDERVLLKPYSENDFTHLLPFAEEEKGLWKYSMVSAAGEDGLRKYFEKALSARISGIEYPFIVFDKKFQQYAGSTRFYDIQIANQSSQLGYTWYGKKFQGSGLNVHCKYLLLSFAFENAGMFRVEFRADARNERSIAAMKKIGCVEEGILRQHMPLEDGTRRDSIILSILKTDWENSVKENLKNLLK
ncbi:MAG: GNAT family protein [Bacteroidota bacterium]